MKPILIHVHLFYPELWGYVRLHLQNIVCYPHLICITSVQDFPTIKEDAQTLGYNIRFFSVANRGYDIAPFLTVIKNVKLDDFSYIIKMHTKRDVKNRFSIQGYDVTGAAWRDYMYDFLKEQNFACCLKSFERNERLGMSGNFRLILNYEPAEDKCWKESVRLLKNSYNVSVTQYSFIAGSMFICRAHLMQPLQKLNLSSEDFEEHQAHNITTLAHILERVMGLIVCSQGYKIEDNYTSFWKKLTANIKRLNFLKKYSKIRKNLINKIKHYQSL